MEGYTFDVQRNLVFNLQGQTDAQGLFSSSSTCQLTSLAAIWKALGRFYLQATVTDLQHSETANLSLPVPPSALVIEAVPEGGRSGLVWKISCT